MSKAKTAFDLQQQYNTATLCEQPRVYKPLRERLKAIDANSPEQIADLTARLAYHEGAECEYCGESLICTDESEYKGQQFPVACMECYGKQVERRVEAEAKLAASLGVLEETGKALELRAGQNPIPLQNTFDSGHMAPSGHPRCRCALGFSGATVASVRHGMSQQGRNEWLGAIGSSLIQQGLAAGLAGAAGA